MTSNAKAATATAEPRPRVRERIFETACGLFYQHGIRAVGVDAIASAAGTNKMSFYRSFVSKDELVADYLRERVRHFWAWWDAAVAPHAGDARAQVEALFIAHAASNCPKTSRGCGLSNAAVEIVAEAHPARQVIVEHRTEIRRRFRKLARGMGARDPGRLGDALMLLMDGGFLSKLTFAKSGPIVAGPEAARALMDAYRA